MISIGRGSQAIRLTTSIFTLFTISLLIVKMVIKTTILMGSGNTSPIMKLITNATKALIIFIAIFIAILLSTTRFIVFSPFVFIHLYLISKMNPQGLNFIDPTRYINTTFLEKFFYIFCLIMVLLFCHNNIFRVFSIFDLT